MKLNPRALALLHLFLALTLLVPFPALATSSTLPVAPDRPKPARPAYTPLFFYRTTVLLKQPANSARLSSLGVQVLDQRPDAAHPSTDSGRTTSTATVLANDTQLATLARLGFEPRGTEELGTLSGANFQAKPWLAESLRPLQVQARIVQQRTEDLGLARRQDVAAMEAAVRGFSPEIRLALASLPSTDDDGDGLTNTEESWWCTDAENPDSDGDTVSDGAEVKALRDWLANRRSKAPDSGPPFRGWPMVPGDNNYDPDCIDRDQDAVPDAAELALGLNPNLESTDRDKFDDGVELFGITKPGWGLLPRPADADVFIDLSHMPSWVKAPGKHPLVAAFPIPEIDVVKDSLHVQARTEITISQDQTITEGTERCIFSIGSGKVRECPRRLQA